jgi:signal transduction histidine kinase
MRERAEMLGGTLEIKADPGNGTIVKAAVPMNGNHKPHEQRH